MKDMFTCDHCQVYGNSKDTILIVLSHKVLKMCITTPKGRLQGVWAPVHSPAQKDTMTTGYRVLHPVKNNQKKPHFL